jgi:hypothetical protein
MEWSIPLLLLMQPFFGRNVTHPHSLGINRPTENKAIDGQNCLIDSDRAQYGSQANWTSGTMFSRLRRVHLVHSNFFQRKPRLLSRIFQHRFHFLAGFANDVVV